MDDSLNINEVKCDLLLNGIPIRTVQIRNVPEFHEDFEIVVTDPALGVFALHEGFQIDVREPDSIRRSVSLAELKAILRRSTLWVVEDLPNASEVSQSRMWASVVDVDRAHSKPSLLSVNGYREVCVQSVCRILYSAGIAHLVSGTTFIVPCAPTARNTLMRTGFRRSEISRSALVEPTTGCAIQLVERDPADWTS
jgi:hypothetical protein